MGRVAGDPAAFVDEETERVAFLDVDREIRIDALAVLALQFLLPHLLRVVQNRHAHSVTVAVCLIDPAADR